MRQSVHFSVKRTQCRKAIFYLGYFLGSHSPGLKPLYFQLGVHPSARPTFSFSTPYFSWRPYPLNSSYPRRPHFSFRTRLSLGISLIPRYWLIIRNPSYLKRFHLSFETPTIPQDLPFPSLSLETQTISWDYTNPSWVQLSHETPPIPRDSS